MGEREPAMQKREIRLPDGRRLVFYEFSEAPAQAEPPSSAGGPRPPRGPAPLPDREER